MALNNRMITFKEWHGPLADLPVDPVILSDAPVVLVGGGDVDLNQLRLLGQDLPLAALDGGVSAIIKAGLKPFVVIGDMDSAPSNLAMDEIANLTIKDQYSTDLEKALAAVDAPIILAMGVLGKRMDHSLATLHAIGGSLPRCPVVVISPEDAMIFARREMVLSLAPSSRISLWPMTTQRFISSQGLVWPLNELVLAAGSQLGTSNQVVDGNGPQSVTITPDTIDDGYVIIVESSQAPALIEALSKN